jgi:hypothetical protein
MSLAFGVIFGPQLYQSIPFALPLLSHSAQASPRGGASLKSEVENWVPAASPLHGASQHLLQLWDVTACSGQPTDLVSVLCPVLKGNHTTVGSYS